MSTEKHVDTSVVFNLDYNTKPTTPPTRKISLRINPNVMIRDWSTVYIDELMRRNLKRFEGSHLTEEDIFYFLRGCLAIRVESVRGKCKNWRAAKELEVPTWIIFCMNQIGKVYDYDFGVEYLPEYIFEYDMGKMLKISAELRTFRQDGMGFRHNAFSPSKEGNYEVMACFIDYYDAPENVDGYNEFEVEVTNSNGQKERKTFRESTQIPENADLSRNFIISIRPNVTPICSYIAGFLGLTLSDYTNLNLLYQRCDDVAYVKSMLMYEEAIL